MFYAEIKKKKYLLEKIYKNSEKEKIWIHLRHENRDQICLHR